MSGIKSAKGEVLRTERGNARGWFDVVRVLMGRPEVPITSLWRISLGHIEDAWVVFEIITISVEGTAAVEGQHCVIERDTVEWGVVGLPFVPTKGISEALRGRALIGRTAYGVVVGSGNINGLRIVKVDTGSAAPL